MQNMTVAAGPAKRISCKHATLPCDTEIMLIAVKDNSTGSTAVQHDLVQVLSMKTGESGHQLCIASQVGQVFVQRHILLCSSSLYHAPQAHQHCQWLPQMRQHC